MITQAKEDYIRALGILGQDGQGVKSKDLCKYLDLAKSTVSERLRELREKKIVKFQRYGDIYLTSKGEKIASKLTFKHRLIEYFLHKKLKVPLSEIHEEANKLEHAFSDKVIRNLDGFLGSPKFDPHGERIKVQ